MPFAIGHELITPDSRIFLDLADGVTDVTKLEATPAPSRRATPESTQAVSVKRRTGALSRTSTSDDGRNSGGNTTRMTRIASSTRSVSNCRTMAVLRNSRVGRRTTSRRDLLETVFVMKAAGNARPEARVRTVRDCTPPQQNAHII